MTRFVIILLILLSCSIPPVTGLYGIYLAPKWYAAIIVTLICLPIYIKTYLSAGNILLSSKPASLKSICISYPLAMAALIANLANLVLVIIYDAIRIDVSHIQDIRFCGVYDNSTGLSLHLCLLSALTTPLLSVNTKHVKCLLSFIIYSTIILATVCITISQCRTGLLCMFFIIIFSIDNMLKLYVKRKYRTTFYITLVVFMTVSLCTMKLVSTNGRRFIIQQTWELIKAKPFVGYGINGFEREYMLQQAYYFKNHPDAAEVWIADDIRHPLNEMLYMWVNYGLFGISIPIMFLILFVHLSLKRKGCLENRQCVMAVIILSTFALTSYPHVYPLPYIISAIVFIQCLKGNMHITIRALRYIYIPVLAISIICIAYTLREMQYEHRWYIQNRLVIHGKAEQTLPTYKELSIHYDDNARFIYSNMMALYLTCRFADAACKYHELIKYSRNYDSELLMGDICAHLHQYDSAIAHYREAHYMVPVRFAPLAGMMEAYDMMGEAIRADSIAQVIVDKPVKIPSAEIEEIKRNARERIINNKNKLAQGGVNLSVIRHF